MKTETKLSTLWIFAMFNYLYADLIGVMDSSLLKQYLTGQVGGLEITPMFLFFSAILMETAIAMVLFSRLLPRAWSRWSNVAVGILHTLAVSASLFVGTVTPYYAFFAVVEIAATLTIIWSAWRWKAEATSNKGVTS